MLIENTLFGKVNKVSKSIQRLKSFEPPEGYWLAFSIIELLRLRIIQKEPNMENVYIAEKKMFL